MTFQSVETNNLPPNIIPQAVIESEVVNDGEHKKSAEELREFYMELGREILTNRANEQFIDFDVEGDGPAGFGSLLSIGAVAPTGETFYVELKPQTETFLPAPHQFCEDHGLSRERLEQEGVSIEEAGRQFKQWVDSLKARYKKPAVATAFNAGYDWAHIDLAFARASVTFPDSFPTNPKYNQPHHNPFGVAPADTKSLALALPRESQDSVNWNWRDTSKNRLPEVVSPDEEFTHNALEDALYQQKQHFAMVGLLNTGKDEELDTIIRERIIARKHTEDSGRPIGKVATDATGLLRLSE